MIKIKFLQIKVNDYFEVENRINEELKGWKITKINFLNIEKQSIISEKVNQYNSIPAPKFIIYLVGEIHE